MRRNSFIFIFCLLSTVYCLGQTPKIDSLILLLKTDKPDTTKLIHLYQISDESETIGNYEDGLNYGNQALQLADLLLNKADVAHSGLETTAKRYKAKAYSNIGIIYSDKGNNEEALKYYSSALKIFIEINDKKGIGNVYNNIGNCYDNQSNNSEALKNYFASLKIREEAGDKKGIAGSYNNIGLIYFNQGNYPEALKNYFASLKMVESIDDKRGIAAALNNIGLVYTNQSNYSEALKKYSASLKIRQAIGNKRGIASSYSNIGLVYEYQGDYAKALENYTASLKIREELEDKEGIASCLTNIGNIYSLEANRLEGNVTKREQLFIKALENYSVSLKIKEEIGDKAGIASSYLNIGHVFIGQKKYKEAGEYLLKSKDISKELGHKRSIRHAYKALTQLDSAKGNYKGAYENHKLYILYRDSLDNEETRKKTIQSQMSYDFEKKEAVAEAEHKKELENQELIADEKSRKQKIVLALVSCFLLLVLLFAGFIFRSLRITRKQKSIIEEQKSIVEKQKQEVELQKNRVEEHQKEIIDSITYARRIQQSLLPTEKYIEKQLTRLMKK